jgi:flagellar assembly factor FliW
MTGLPQDGSTADLQPLDTPFGSFDLGAQDVIAFPSGLPGFETERRFVLLSAEAFEPVQCLQSIHGPSPSFLVVDPRRVLDDYRTRLNQSDLARLGAADDTALLWLAIVTVTDDGMFANLRAPVVINPARMLGFQLVPSDSLYPLRHALFVE